MTNRVYTGGTFDLFHHGHVNLLRYCAKIAGENGEVIVGLNTDEFIEEYKGTAPVMSYEERSSVLRSCQYVNEVHPNIGGADSKPAILYARANFIVIGDDWACRDYYSQMGFDQNWLDLRGITLIYVPYTQEISTTTIIKRCYQRELARNTEKVIETSRSHLPINPAKFDINKLFTVDRDKRFDRDKRIG